MRAPSLHPELLSPAGDWECVRAAVANGANAVYFGMPRFNARMRAENFKEEELPELVGYLHSYGVKAYVTLNVLIFTDEMQEAVAELRLLNDAGVDAVIIQDVGVAELARRMFPALRVHASTQMTITSPEGVRFAEELGAKQVVLAREISLRELEKFDGDMPLEMFVHGALCVAYSGQCLTSESLGQRSANRGECAQACRMPYQLVVDGALQDLGDKRYLLSPQDLAAVQEIPDLIRRGVVSFKIEGRLKSPEYVAAVTSVYRKAIDAALGELENQPSEEDWHKLEMTFSRGLFSGWMHGVNHQKLVGAEYGKKRGALAGRVTTIGRDHVEMDTVASLKTGDGVVFENLSDTNAEQGGRVYQLHGLSLYFQHGKIDFRKIAVGTRVWKTDDQVLNADLKKTYRSRIQKTLKGKTGLILSFRGKVGEPLTVTVECETLSSTLPLQTSQKQPLSRETLEDVFSRLHDTPYFLENIESGPEGSVYLPKSELNRLKTELIQLLETKRRNERRPSGVELKDILAPIAARRKTPSPASAELSVLCRDMAQVEVALEHGCRTVYVDFEDIRRYKEAVEMGRKFPESAIFLATPRIQKAGEQGFFKLIEGMEPDGVLIRNVGAIAHFQKSPLRKIGDFSLNVANPLAAEVFISRGLERVTISYDLNISQVLALAQSAPPEWFELTLHQHMPMFHMEHCVFAAFMSKGTTFLDCGRPCESHRVHLRDRVGVEHPLRADVGCRNTLFNAVAQTGAAHYEELREAGVAHFRVELLEEGRAQTEKALRAYQELIDGAASGGELWRSLKAQSQLGVTKGTLADAHR
ncbi:DUF3656 domain-containing protein [soil metagenome]